MTWYNTPSRDWNLIFEVQILIRESKELPSHDLLLDIFEKPFCETFGKNVSQLFNCVNFVQLDISLENLFTKPNYLDCVILASRSELWRQGFGQHKHSQIVFIHGDIHGCISNWKIGSHS
jgi:hypothetical protein